MNLRRKIDFRRIRDLQDTSRVAISDSAGLLQVSISQSKVVFVGSDATELNGVKPRMQNFCLRYSILLSSFDFPLYYTGGRQDMPPTFQSCLERAKQLVQDEVSSLRLAGAFLEHEYRLRESDGRVKAAENLVNHYIELEAQWNTTLQKMDCLRTMERCSSSGVLKSMGAHRKAI